MKTIEFNEEDMKDLDTSFKNKMAMQTEMYNNERYYNFTEYFEKYKKLVDP